MPLIIVILPGQRFGRLTIIRELEPIRELKCTRRRFECRCDCGAVLSVMLHSMRKGLSKSCGCYRRDRAREDSTTHGDNGTPELRTWWRLKGRCCDPKDKSWPDYGGRGITLCDEWRHDYAAFLAYIGRRPGPGYSIERIDNDVGYRPGNVRWATRKEQNRNKRNTVFVEYGGVRRLFVEVCEETGLDYHTVKRRRQHGWADVDLFRPLIKHGTLDRQKRCESDPD